MARRCVLSLSMCLMLAFVFTTSAAAVASTTVAVAKVPGAGAVLVDGATGRTLYTLTDSSGRARPCTGACLSTWPALSAGAGAQATAPSRVRGIGTTADGAVSAKGHPLYLFSGDPAAGTANGNGITSFGGTWRVVRITGKAAKAAKPATAIGQAGSAGGGATTVTTNPVQGYGY
jgi:predicted lipoprotein with Yx(FWY)xxD motif